MHRVITLTVFFLVFSVCAQQKLVAIINTVDDEEPPIKNSELIHLTDRLREIATKTLPQRSYAVMTQQSILSLFSSPEDMMNKCNELSGCLVKIGREIAADYIGQARIGRFGGDLTIKVELYETGKGTLVSSFTGSSYDIYGLLSVLDEKAPEMFRRMPGVYGGVAGSSSFAGGISGVQGGVGDYKMDASKHYLVNLTTEPADATLSFDGMPIASCPKTPCKVELTEGKVRIIAALEQYEISDTTISVKRNNQDINIKLKPNFGVLEIDPAYLNEIGKNKQWDLIIDYKSYSFGRIRLSPGEYAVKLYHDCYEDIGFKIGINKGSREVFDMTNYIKLKQGGLSLSAERDGEPVSESVFINGKRVGETPFSGSVAVCSDVKVGKEKANVKLKNGQIVRYTHKMGARETYTDKEKRRIRFGFVAGGGGIGELGGDELYEDTNNGGGSYEGRIGLSLDIPIIDTKLIWGPEVHYIYRKFVVNDLYDEIIDHVIAIPVMLTYKFHVDNLYVQAESGVQFGFPFSAITGRKSPDYEIISGLGLGESLHDGNCHFSFRFGYNFGDFNKKKGFTSFEFVVKGVFGK